MTAPGRLETPSARRCARPSSTLGIVFVCALLAGGCATTRELFSPAAPVSGEPWQLPPDAYPTQRLYRVKYQGPEGDAGFKLTLYLEAEGKYRMLAADLGRKLWSLSVDGQGEAIWLNYRQKEYCRASAAGQIRFVPLADLPLVSLPRLLLGRMPVEPAASLAQGESSVTFLDGRGFRWDASLEGGELEWWSLLESGEPVAWWRRRDGEDVFVDRRGDQVVRWREVVRERLDEPLADLEIPPEYREGVCGAEAR